VNTLLERLNAAYIELKDIADEAGHLIGRVDLDPREAQQKRERLDELLRLQQKHRVSGTAELIAIRDDLSQRTRHIGSLDERIADLASRTTELSVKAMTLAKELSKERTKAVKPLALQLERILHDLGMPDAVLQFDHRKVEIGPQGLDAVRALFTANKDRAPAPLDKVASGGELSRVMLALISLAADSQGLSTVIFDEIDTGVSGEVADRVGSLMARMGKERQVLAITHLPQIASKATHHLLVSKSGTEGRVSTTLSQLNTEQRVEAIAQMLSGRKLTKQALENARVLLKQR
jgi:DNA repair protein RecN (Recombination protein N)